MSEPHGFYLKVPVPPGFGSDGDGVIEVLRSNAVLRRVESRFGAIDPFSRRLASAAATAAEIEALIACLIEDAPDTVYAVPSRKDLAAWLFDVGTIMIAARLAHEIYALVIGSDALAALIVRRRGRDGAPASVAEDDEADRPFLVTGASTGRSGS